MPVAASELSINTPISEVGEFGLLESILPTIPSSSAVRIGTGDDGAVVRIQGDAVVSTDVLVEGVHFRSDWSQAHDVGRKAVAVNVSDLNAMACEPVAMVLGFSAPGNTTVGWVQEFMAGVLAEAKKADIALVGGDITSSKIITVSVTVFGQTRHRPPVLRKGAQPGDVVAVCGQLGWASAGLAVLSRGFRSPRAVVDAQRVPSPPYGQGIVAADAGAHAMIDISDGLLADLDHIAQASSVKIDLDSAAFELPEPLLAVCAATGKDPLNFVLTGGEDHALAATFADSEAVPQDWRIVGKVLCGQSDVTVDGLAYEGEQGWDHYRH